MATPKTRKHTRRNRANKPAPTAKPKQSAVAPQRAAKPEPAPIEPVQRHWWQRTPASERPSYHNLPSAIALLKSAYRLLTLDWRLILGIAAVYGVLNMLLVRGLNGGLDITQLKAEFNQLYSGGWANIASGFSIFALLVSSSNSGDSDAAGAYQSFLVIITSLALVWTFRQLLADNPKPLRVRDGFYKGMYPLIPILLIIVFIFIQMIPLLLGGLALGVVVANGLAVTWIELVFWVMLFFLTVLWSLFWVVPSVFALYIATLPDMRPWQAIRSGKTLVRFRRGTVLRKVLFLPLFILLILGAIIIPIIFVVPVLAQWVFFALSTLILPVVHSYLYTLYRELLHE